jgi:hypothetical protein
MGAAFLCRSSIMAAISCTICDDSLVIVAVEGGWVAICGVAIGGRLTLNLFQNFLPAVIVRFAGFYPRFFAVCVYVASDLRVEFIE